MEINLKTRGKDYIIARTTENQDGCWIWQRGSDRYGYGQSDTGIIKHYTQSTGVRNRMKARYQAITAHRLSFYLWNGYLPVVVRHICNNRQCCNPLHLLDGDHSDNLVDRYLQRITDRLTTLHGWTYAEVAKLISD